jgi:hypothetical protein
MRKLAVVASFVALAFATYPVAACDWEHEASTSDNTVASATGQTTPQATPTCAGADCSAPQPTSVASKQTDRKDASENWPVILVTDRK